MTTKSGQSSPTIADKEVENVMLKQELPEFQNCQPHFVSPTSSKSSHSTPDQIVHLSGLGQDGSRKSAFSPYKPTTVLTNLQRGNIETRTTCFLPDPSTHQLAAQGELILDDETTDVDLDEQDKGGFTPLMWACYHGQVPIVTSLLSRGVNINATNSKGENALLFASCNGHSDIVKILLEHKMNVDHTDEQGNTALMYAAFNNQAHCTQELLLHNADITKDNHYGDTAFSIAVARGSKQVQVILERYLLQLLENS